MNLIRATIAMVIYLAIIIITYLVISTPFDNMMTSMEDVGNSSGVGTYTAQSGTNSRLAFNIFFLGLALIPFGYFIMMVLSREPDWGYYE